MASFENTVIIQRPVEDVFAFLADFQNIPKWNYAIVETMKLSPGPVGVGTTYHQRGSVVSMTSCLEFNERVRDAFHDGRCGRSVGVLPHGSPARPLASHMKVSRSAGARRD